MVQFCRKNMDSLCEQHDDTQIQSLSGGNCKDKDFDHILGCTFPFMDTAPLDDGSETQVMNFEDETQVLFEDGMETQVMNFEGETQVLFEYGLETQVMTFIDETQLLDDFDGFENMDTQLLDEWNNDKTDKTDGEQLEKTDMLCDTDVKSENDSVKLVVCLPDRENSNIFKEDANKEELEALFYKQTSAGIKLDFTSIRVAAMRASGLAARSKVLNRNVSELCLLKSKNGSPKENLTPKDSSATGIRAPHFHAVEVDEGALEEEQVKEKEEESKGRIGNSAVRQLSMVDVELVENEGLNSNYQGEVKDVELSLSNGLVGLSYADSQEPGDLSQANALDFVNKFVNASDRDFGEAFDIIGSTTKNSKSVWSLKGIQNLARKSGLKSISDENGIYDWDDNREDEGGGEFFSRQKRVFFDDEGKGSPSKLNSSHRAAKKVKVAEVKRNRSKKVHLELNVDSLDGRKATCTGKDLQDMLNVGPDTQMAAEAMEVLSLGLNLTSRESKGVSGNAKHTHQCSSIGGKEDKKVCKYFLRKRSGSSSSGNLTRKSKQQKISGTNLNREMTVASSKQSKSTRKQHNDFDTSNVVLPRGQEKVRTCTPIASRTRHRSLTQQSVGGNILFDTITGISYGKRRQSHEELLDNGHRPAIKFAGQQRNEKPCELLNRLKSNPQSFPLDQGITRLTRSSLRVVTAFSSSDKECERNFCNQSGGREDSEEDILKLKLPDREHSPGERSKLSVFTSITPAGCTSSGGAASPICMGDEYFKQSCSKNLSKSFTMKEIANKVSHRSEPTSAIKESRRRDMADVRVMLSRHLDDDIIKHQKKILAKLGASVAPSIREATHFVTDKFVRTRNMLEAIAFGKPVVTHLWLESCGQASCCVDEKNYLLRDAKKEKEFGFSLPASLEHACQHPLLQGLKVWITPNTKPGVEILSSLVKAVHGLPMERIGRSVLKDDIVPDDLIVLSCKEDYAACLPIIEKGGVVFSSELLLNGIVTQKLEYERYRLFDDHVKKTRSTLWLKQDSSQYLRVANCK